MTTKTKPQESKIEKELHKELGKNYVFKLMKYFLPYKKIVVLCVFFIMLSILVGIATPKINSYLTDNVIPNQKLLAFIWVVVGIAALEFTNIFAAFFKSKLINKFGYEIIGKIRNDVYDKLTLVSMDYFNENATGSLLAKSTAYVDNIASFYTSYIFTLIEHTLRLCLVIPFLISCSPTLTLLGVGIIIPIAIGIVFIIKLAKKRSNDYYEGQSQAYNALVETISGIATVNAFNKQEENLELYSKKVKKNYKEWYALSRVNDSYHLWFDTVYNAAIACIFILSFVLISQNQLTFAIYVAYIGYQGQLWTPFYYFVQLFNSFVSLTGNLQQVFNTLEAEEKIIDSNFAKSHTLKGNITVKNLSFAYEDKNVINDVSLYVKVGQKLTLCGLANSGKSTLVELIGRLYQFNQGSIFFDEYNINSIKLSSIHKNVGIVQQNTFMLHDSILENIRFGNKKATFEECVNACNLIGANEFIEKLGGYNKIVGVDFELSDGEKQLINLARLIVHNPNIVIYDEALNSFTEEDEANIVNKLKKHFKTKTMFIVTNNKQIIEDSEYIYYMKNGEISEHGTFEQLVNLNGRFKKDIFKGVKISTLLNNAQPSAEPSSTNEAESHEIAMKIEKQIKKEKEGKKPKKPRKIKYRPETD